MDDSKVFDQLAFAGYGPRELIAKIAADVFKKTQFPSLINPMMPTNERIERHIAELVETYGGRLAGLTRKNLVQRVRREIVNQQRRAARKEGKVFYLYPGP
jgi:hypothetical protein